MERHEAAEFEGGKHPCHVSQVQPADSLAEDDQAIVQLRMEHLSCILLLLHAGASLTHEQHAKLCDAHTILCNGAEDTASKVTAPHFAKGI